MYYIRYPEQQFHEATLEHVFKLNRRIAKTITTDYLEATFDAKTSLQITDQMQTPKEMINNLFHMNYITSDLVVLGLAG